MRVASFVQAFLTGRRLAQVLKAWEALLASVVAALPPERRPAGQGALEGLVRRRLAGSEASTRRRAEKKRIFADGEQNWIMMKVHTWASSDMWLSSQAAGSQSSG